MTKITAILISSALCGGSAFAQGGDDCTVPTAINAFGTFALDTTAATTSGFDGGGSCAIGSTTINQDLFWIFTVPSAGDIQFDTNGSSFDTKLSVHTGGNCSATCTDHDDDGGDGLDSLIQINGVTAGTVLLIQVGGFGTANGTGQLNVGFSPCFNAIDDSFEDNDSCTAPVNVALGSFPGLFVSTTDLDYYRVTVPANEIFRVAVSNASPATTDVAIFDASCNPLVTSGSGTASYSTIGSAGPVDLIVEVAVDSFSSQSCTIYDLDLSSAPDPCSLGPDAFEENDDCAGALPLGDGLYTELTVFDSDNDYFALNVAPGATLTADIFFLDANADVDLYLWDPTIECDTNVAGTGGAFLVRGFSVDDDEQVVYTNMTGAAQDLILEVDMFSAGGCNTYDLMLDGADGMGPGPGSNYCMTNANSAGTLSTITAIGSRTVADNDVTLVATDLPPLKFGFFLASRSQGFVMNPGGSQGNLCLGGAIGRFVLPGQIQNSGNAGEIVLQLDLGAIPQPLGPEAVAPGDLWNFQLWHRDTVQGASTSNLTEGIQIDFI